MAILSRPEGGCPFPLRPLGLIVKSKTEFSLLAVIAINLYSIAIFSVMIL